jgi:hypothetical protein
MTMSQGRVRTARAFTRPRLQTWSIKQAEPVEVTGAARADYERELRISALGALLCSPAATPLWRRVCMHTMCGEIRARSNDQRLAMELALLEATR